MRSPRSILAVAAAASALAAAASCSRTEPAPGVLMLAIQTDMSAGRDKTIQAVGLYVRDLDRGRTLFQLTEPVAPDGTVRFPATLAIIGRNNPGASVRIRVVGFRRGEAQVMRDAVTTIPTDRTALMQLPLRWVNYEKATGAIPQGSSTGPASVHTLADDDPASDPFGVLAYKGCAGQNTFIDGQCVSWDVDSSKLPSFVEAEVFGGGTADGGGACFDTETCFAKSTPLAVDNCVAVKPPGTFALAVKQGPGEEGACVGDGCYIPLDPESDEGWKTEGANIRLTPGTCARLVEGGHTLVASSTCSKTVSAPLCGEASAVGPGTDLPTDLDGGLDSTLVDARADAPLDAGPPPFELASGMASPTQIVQDTNNVYVVTRGGIVLRANKTAGNAMPINGGFDAGAPTNDDYKIAISPAKDRLVLGRVGGSFARSYAVPIGSPVTNLNLGPSPLAAIAVSSTHMVYLDAAGVLRKCILTGCGGTEPPTMTSPPTSFLAYDPTLNSEFLVGLAPANPALLTVIRHDLTGTPPQIAEGIAPAGPITFDVGQTGNAYWMTTGASGGIYAATKTSAGSTSQGILIVSDDLSIPTLSAPKVTHELVVDNNDLFWTNAKGEVRGARAKVPTTAKTLAQGQSTPMGIAVDASFIYWTTMGDGKLWRLPRTPLP